MTPMACGRLIFRALFELLLFDLRKTPFGNQPTSHVLPAHASERPGPEIESQICNAVLLATCLYWKPVLCLQRSVCLVRMLRDCGVPARLVVGYRALPFFSHAWVEVDGRVVNDSPVYRERLQVLYTA
jgi:hypothetical protein